MQNAKTMPDDLEALFDSVAAEYRAPASPPAAAEPPAALAATPPGGAANDPVLPPSGDAAGHEPHDIFKRIGALTRNLHDALRELGYDKNVEKAVTALPDARARLAYIATLTGNAAERALGACERGREIQDALQHEAAALSSQWNAVFEQRASVDEFRATAQATRTFIDAVAARGDETNAQFHDIMMAQDFHDLTGQVINRIVSLAQGLEDQLVTLLLDATPPEHRAESESAWLSGPVVDGQGRSDVVTSQGQVDDLLESLGF